MGTGLLLVGFWVAQRGSWDPRFGGHRAHGWRRWHLVPWGLMSVLRV